MKPAKTLTPAPFHASVKEALAKMHRLEADEQKALFAFLRTFAHLAPEFDAVHASLNGIHLPTPKLKDEASAQGMTAGVWDVFCPATRALLESGILDAGLYIEMKVPGRDLTGEQKAFRDSLSIAFRFEVCKSWHEAAGKVVAFYRVSNPAIREAIR